ncbi:MAG: MFS transporter [Porticoccaceae bacterium]
MSSPAKEASASPWQQLLRNTQFRWLFTGNITMFTGFAATILLRSLLAWQLTGDEMSLAYINLVSAGCMFVTSIFSGAVIDRFERRRLMMIAQCLILVAEFSVMLLLVTGHLTFSLLMVSAFSSSVAFPFIMPSSTAMLVAAVGRPVLGKATALMSAGANVARMVSPAVVGILADLAGMAASYVFLITLHLFSLFCTFNLNPSLASGPGRGAFLGEIREGFTYLYRHKPVALCIAFGLIPTLIVVPLQNLLVVFVDEVWDHSGSGLGIMMGAMGVGGLLGSLLMALTRDGSLVKPMLTSALALGIFLLLFSHTPWFWLATVFMVGIYACSVLSQTLVQTGVQLMTADHMRGRITTMTLMSYGLAPLGTIPLAFASKHIGAPWAMTIAAVLMLIAVIAMGSLSRGFRQIDARAKVG